MRSQPSPFGFGLVNATGKNVHEGMRRSGALQSRPASVSEMQVPVGLTRRIEKVCRGTQVCAVNRVILGRTS